MRYGGKVYTGKGVKVAIVDSGVDPADPRLAGVKISGWSIRLSATNHSQLSADFKDENGHGTEMAAAVHHLAPDAEIVAVKIMGERLRTSAELMASGIELSARIGCAVINMSLGTPNMGKSLLLRDCCAKAVEAGSVVLAAAHPKGERVYPAELPETVGVATHRDCPLDKFFYFDPQRFNRREWGVLSDKFLAHGYALGTDGQPGRFRGTSLATAYLSGITACLAEAIPQHTAAELIDALRRKALVPVPEIGYT